jgi:hypothetical protein
MVLVSSKIQVHARERCKLGGTQGYLPKGIFPSPSSTYSSQLLLCHLLALTSLLNLAREREFHGFHCASRWGFKRESSQKASKKNGEDSSASCLFQSGATNITTPPTTATTIKTNDHSNNETRRVKNKRPNKPGPASSALSNAR